MMEINDAASQWILTISPLGSRIDGHRIRRSSGVLLATIPSRIAELRPQTERLGSGGINWARLVVTENKEGLLQPSGKSTSGNTIGDLEEKVNYSIHVKNELFGKKIGPPINTCDFGTPYTSNR